MKYAETLLLGVVVTLGCSSMTLARIAGVEDDRFARAYIDSVRLGRLEYAMSVMAPALAGRADLRDSLAAIAGYMPAGTLDSVRLIGANRFTSASVDRVQLVYELHSANGWGVTAVTVARDSGGRYVAAMHAERLAESLEVANAFTLRGKGPGHYLMIAVMLACAGAAFYTATLAIRTPMRRRWLWALFALVGAGTIVFNWSTGEVGFQLLQLLLFDAAFQRSSAASPWIFSAAFPIGAFLTLAKINSIRSEAARAKTDQPAPAGGDATP